MLLFFFIHIHTAEIFHNVSIIEYKPFNFRLFFQISVKNANPFLFNKTHLFLIIQIIYDRSDIIQFNEIRIFISSVYYYLIYNGHKSVTLKCH